MNSSTKSDSDYLIAAPMTGPGGVTPVAQNQAQTSPSQAGTNTNTNGQ